jgi:hypothetical protein
MPLPFALALGALGLVIVIIVGVPFLRACAGADRRGRR